MWQRWGALGAYNLGPNIGAVLPSKVQALLVPSRTPPPSARSRALLGWQTARASLNAVPLGVLPPILLCTERAVRLLEIRGASTNRLLELRPARPKRRPGIVAS